MTSEVPSPPEVDADAGGAGTRFAHHWSVVVGAGRAAEALRADWQQHLGRAVGDVGFRYVRFHGLFHDDMFVYRRTADGTRHLTFGYVDRVFDALLAAGIRPFVEFGFMPADLARSHGTVFWWRGNGAPPTSLDEWTVLVEETVRHWVGRYGLDEVRSWYFEVWNEPNLHPFWQGTRSEYFALYAATARAVKGIDDSLRVGGPATSNFVPDSRFDGETEDVEAHVRVTDTTDLSALDWRPVWLAEFFAFCRDNDLPVDFVSTHPYPTDWALDEHGEGARRTRDRDATERDLRLLRRLVDESPFPQAEIHLTEWSSSSSSRDLTHDSLPAATYVVRTNLRTIGLVDSLAYWTFTDVFEEQGAGIGPFHGGFGMLNEHGIPKPVFHAYRLLSSLGDVLLHRSDVGVVTRSSLTGAVSALFHNYPDEEAMTVPACETYAELDRLLARGRARTVRVRVSGLSPRAVFATQEVDAQHGDVLGPWRAAGRPENLDLEQARALSAVAEELGSAVHQADERGVLDVELVMAPWSVVGLQQVDG
ncbi:beta-xylosidase [Actinotalea sp.]|uniref:GH39 family glycosyl hydrolase n=1 Tax=Actinotalea sp. TaxID=1872145 RepID=UPI00356A1447